jgi:hypothetical protein
MDHKERLKNSYESSKYAKPDENENEREQSDYYLRPSTIDNLPLTNIDKARNTERTQRR